MQTIVNAVILERIAELLDSKKSMSQALRTVAWEIRTLDKYCNDNYVKITAEKLRTDHLREGRFKG